MDNTYQASIAMINKERAPEGFATEHQMTIIFVATDKYDAVKAAKRFADDRLKAWAETFSSIGCIKVYSFHPSRIEDDGSYAPPTGCWFFEWKCDFPGRFEDWLNRLKS